MGILTYRQYLDALTLAEIIPFFMCSRDDLMELLDDIESEPDALAQMLLGPLEDSPMLLHVLRDATGDEEFEPQHEDDFGPEKVYFRLIDSLTERLTDIKAGGGGRYTRYTVDPDEYMPPPDDIEQDDLTFETLACMGVYDHLMEEDLLSLASEFLPAPDPDDEEIDPEKWWARPAGYVQHALREEN
jgi:hypothetical protein